MKLKRYRLLASILLLTSITILIHVPTAIQTEPIEDLDRFLNMDEHEGKLELKSLTIERIKRTSAEVVWQTSHPAYSKIQWGLSRNLSQSQSLMQPKKHRKFTLEGLEPGRTYSVRITCWDNQDRRVRSDVVTFQTTGLPAPKLTSVRIPQSSRSAGTIQWQTNIPVNTTLSLGYDTGTMTEYGSDKTDREHSVQFKPYRPSKTLFYKITLKDTQGRQFSSGIREKKLSLDNVTEGQPVSGTFDQPLYGVSEKYTGSKPYLNRINDGDYSFQHGTATSGDPSDTAQWFRVQLEREYVPDTAVFYWKAYAYPKKYSIYGSKDAENWRRIKSGLNAKNGEFIRKAGIPSVRHVVSFPDLQRSYRFLKVLIPRGAAYFAKFDSYNFVQLQEFEVYPRISTSSKNHHSIRLITAEDQAK